MLNRIAALKEIQDLATRVDPWIVGAALLLSLATSFFTSWLYVRFYERRGTGSQIHRAFSLLALSITTLFICIQVSLPLSLGLLGALSIVRFRTSIKEPEEIGFIMVVIASSIVCATFHFHLLTFLYLFLLVALLAGRWVRRWQAGSGDGMILISLRETDAASQEARITECVRRFTQKSALESVTARDGLASLHYSFHGFQGKVSDFQAGIREAAPQLAAVSVFFNRPDAMP